MDWNFFVQVGILLCLLVLVVRSFTLENIIHAHFDEIHEDQKNHSELLANLPTDRDMKQIMRK